MKSEIVINKIIKQAEYNIETVTGKKVTLKIVNSVIDEQMRQVCVKICEVWGIDFKWLIDKGRADRKPIMKKVLLLMLEKNFPDARYIDIALSIGYTDHASVHHGLKVAKAYLSVNDSIFMEYYEPVKHFIHEPEAVN